MGKWEEAQELWEGVFDRRKGIVGRDAYFLLKPLMQLCLSLKEQKKRRELRRRRSECIEVAGALYGKGSRAVREIIEILEDEEELEEEEEERKEDKNKGEKREEGSL